MPTETETVASFDTHLISASFFRALGDPTRLRLVVALAAFGCDVCVCELVYGLQVPQYRVSKHLAVLARQGLVTSAHRGTWVRYRVSDELPSQFRECLLALSVREPHRADVGRLKDRMLLRDEQGLCSVGFVPESDLERLIEKARGGCCAAAQGRRT